MGLFSSLFQTKAVPKALVAIFNQRNAQWADFNAQGAITEGYKSVPWVYAAVKKRADSVASVPLKVQSLVNNEWVDAPTHPLQRLLNNPNQDFDYGEMMRLFVTHLDLAGNAYMFKTRGGRTNQPQELWPLLPQYMTVLSGVDRLIGGYEYSQNGRTQYASDDIVHAAYTNPDSLFLGQSPLQAAAKAVDTDNDAAAWQKVSMQNRGVPDGLLSFDTDELTEEQYAQVKEQINKDYTGSGNARKPWVMSKGKFQQMAMTPVELDFMATRNFTMDQICAVYGVPREMINGMGDANRASGDNVRKTFWLDTIIPLLHEIESTLNLNLVPDFGDIKTLRLKFDTSSVPALQENYTEKVQNATALWNMGYPINEINKKLELGFDDVEGGDIGYIPSGVIPSSFDSGFVDGTNTNGE